MNLYKGTQSKSNRWIWICVLVVVLVLMTLFIIKKGTEKQETDVQTSTESSEVVESTGQTSEESSIEETETTQLNSEETTTQEPQISTEEISEIAETSEAVEPTTVDESTTVASTQGTTEAEKDKPISGDMVQDLIPTEEQAEEEELIIGSNFSCFSGQFVEDGRDEWVQNVAAILVTNTSDKFLDLATLQYNIDGKTATFIATGLPAGQSAWVMETSKMVISTDATFTYLGCVTAYKDGVIASTNKVTITSDGNMLTAVNNTQETLEGVFVYYKVRHTDGNYFGGITYVVDFGTLKPGESSETLAGHYVEGKTEIVRIGWQAS